MILKAIVLDNKYLAILKGNRQIEIFDTEDFIKNAIMRGADISKGLTSNGFAIWFSNGWDTDYEHLYDSAHSEDNGSDIIVPMSSTDFITTHPTLKTQLMPLLLIAKSKLRKRAIINAIKWKENWFGESSEDTLAPIFKLFNIQIAMHDTGNMGLNRYPHIHALLDDADFEFDLHGKVRDFRGLLPLSSILKVKKFIQRNKIELLKLYTNYQYARYPYLFTQKNIKDIKN